MPESAAGHAEELMRMICGNWPSQCVYVAAKLGLADHLARGPKNISELASLTGTQTGFLFRVMRALASLGIFEETRPRTFAINERGQLLRRDVPSSLQALSIMMSEEHYTVWGRLLEAVQTGANMFEAEYQAPVFDWLSRHPDKAAIFDDAMTGINGRETGEVLEAYDFSGIKVLADIGGGNGSNLVAILQKHPHLKGILFDLPHVIERARDVISDAGLADRIELISGSFFETIPTGADAYFMRHIIHDWEDDLALKILQKCHQAMSSDARLLIVESVVPSGNTPGFVKLLDLTMMLIPGGMERTSDEYDDLLKKAGFKLERIVSTTGEIGVVEGRKA